MNVLTILSVVSAFVIAGVAAFDNGPAIAMKCGKTNMIFDTVKGDWMPDQDGTDCLADESEVLLHCQKKYPDAAITSVLKSSEKVTISGWCNKGRSSHCGGHSRSVYPYKCITGGASSILELGPVIMDTKVETTTGSDSDHILKICSSPRESGSCRAAFSMFYFDMDTGSCKSFSYGGCGGNDNRFETLSRCEEVCKEYLVQHDDTTTPPRDEDYDDVLYLDDIDDLSAKSPKQSATEKPVELVTEDGEDPCTLPKVVGMCRASFPRWHFNPKSGKCEGFIYGGCGKNSNNFESKEECNKVCARPKTTQAAPTTTSDDSEKSTGQFSLIPRELQQKLTFEQNNYKNLIKDENSRFEEEVSKIERDNQAGLMDEKQFNRKMKAAEEFHQKILSELNQVYQLHFDELMSQVRTSTFDQFRSQVESEEPDVEQLALAMQEYVLSEKMDQENCVTNYNRLIDQFKNSVRTKEAVQDITNTISSLQERVDNVQKRVNENIRGLRDEIQEKISNEIADALKDMEPVTFKLVVISDSEYNFGDDEEYYEDGSSGDAEQYFDKAESPVDERVHVSVQHVDEVEVENDILTLKSKYDVTDVDQSAMSLTWWMFWTVVFLVVTLSILFVARVTTANRRKALKKNQHRHQQVSKALTPEERQLLQMQQNGFENPTYKFFEKHQVA